MFSDFVDFTIKSIIFILPSYIANGAPVISSKIFIRRHPIDMGKVFIDHKRIFGDGKTYEGFMIGLITGTLTGLFLETFSYHTVEGAFILSLGTLLGDLIGSFIKRRIGIKRGQKAPFLDQLTFLYFALFLYYFFYDAIEVNIIIFLSIITPILHRFTNYVAYKLKLKEYPW